MKYLAIFFSLFLLMNIDANAVSANAKKKYPYVLLTDDYGILNENDLGDFTWRMKSRPATMTNGGYNYWQCFPREFIMVMLSDNGHSASELGGKDNVAYLKIYVLLGGGIKHDYEMRSIWSIKDFQKRFNKWLKLMQGEKYVCLGGEFVDQEKEVRNGKTWVTYGWMFERLKTKKGCDTYFDSCTPTYEAYLRQEKKDKQLLANSWLLNP